MDWSSVLRSRTAWLERRCAEDPGVDTAVLLYFVRQLESRATELPRKGEQRMAVTALLELSCFSLEDEPDSRNMFDVFISYKHRENAATAVKLVQILRERGLTIWFDRDEMGDTGRRRDQAIKRRLQRALSRSSFTVIFQTEDVATVEVDFRGDNTLHNWLAFEARHSNALIQVAPTGEVWLPTGLVRSFEDVEQLAAIIVECKEQHGEGIRQEAVSASGPGEDLDIGARRLRASLEKYFGYEPQISSLAELSMLAPADASAASPATMGDAILVQLLRLDPGAALAFHRAGLDPLWLLATGATVNRTRWNTAGDFVAEDIFGPLFVVDPPNLPKRRIGTRELLLGLLAQAAHNSFQRSLLRKAAKQCYAPSTEVEVDDRTDTIALDVRKRLRNRREHLDGMAWLFVMADQTLRAIPASECGVYQTPLFGRSTLLVEQSHRVFTAQSRTDFETVLACADPSALDELLTVHKEIRRTLQGGLFRSRVVDISPPGSSGRQLVFDEGLATTLATSVRPSELSYVVSNISSSVGADEQVDWLDGLRPWKACILVRLANAPEAERMSTIHLALSVLGPLTSYLMVRELDYVDFDDQGRHPDAQLDPVL
jgi:hypothetical protein